MREPRLVSTAAAREYLGGRHPTEFGVKPIGNGRGQVWDIRALDHALDNLAGIAPPAVAPTTAEQDQIDEFEELRKRIAARVLRERSKSGRGRA